MKALCKQIISKLKENRLRLGLFTTALIVVMLATMFPIHIETGDSIDNAVRQLGQGTYRLTIGNRVCAQGANYTCDGTNDNAEFQQALDALPAIGGQLFVLAGAYSFNATVTRAIDNVSIIGVGASVSFSNDDSTPIFEAGGDKWLFSNFQTDAGGLDMGETSDYLWLNVFIDGTLYSIYPSPAPDLTEIEEAIAALEGDVATLQSDLSTVQSDLTTLEGTVSGHTTSIGTLEGDVSTLQSDVSTIQSDLSTVQSDVSTLQSDVSTLQSDVSTLQSDVSTLQSDLSTLSSTVSEISSNVTTLQGDVSDLQSSVSTLESNVSTLQSDVSTLQSDVSDLQSAVSDLQSRMTAAENDISNLSGNLTAHEDATDVHGVWMDYQGRRLMIINPYVSATNRYKVQLHGHTTGSDGVDTPAEYMTAYLNAGYDAAAITDHDVVTADPSIGGILFISGVEESCYQMHIANTFATNPTAEIQAQEVLDDILLDHGLPDIAHPWYSGIPVSRNRIEELVGYQFIEIANSKCAQLGDTETNETYWDAALTMGKGVWGLGVDDSHNVSDSAQFNRNYVEICADDCTLADLKDSLVNGNFYIRQMGGVELTITMSGNDVTCESDAAMDIEWVGRDGLVLFSEDNVSSSTYEIIGWEQYVRARAVDHATGLIYTWTQPIWILTPGTIPYREDNETVWLDAGTTPLADLDRSSDTSEGGDSWVVLDLTAFASAGARIAIIKMSVHTDTIGATGSLAFGVRAEGYITGAYPVVSYAYNQVVAPAWYFTYAFIGMDEEQLVEYSITNTAWTGWQVDCYLQIMGYIE